MQRTAKGPTSRGPLHPPDRKSTRLNSSHLVISYAVFCLKKKKKTSSPPRTSPTARPREISGHTTPPAPTDPVSPRSAPPCHFSSRPRPPQPSPRAANLTPAAAP